MLPICPRGPNHLQLRNTNADLKDIRCQRGAVGGLQFLEGHWVSAMTKRWGRFWWVQRSAGSLSWGGHSLSPSPICIALSRVQLTQSNYCNSSYFISSLPPLLSCLDPCTWLLFSHWTQLRCEVMSVVAEHRIAFFVWMPLTRTVVSFGIYLLFLQRALQ